MHILIFILVALVAAALIYRHVIAKEAKEVAADADALKNSAEKTVAADVTKVEKAV